MSKQPSGSTRRHADQHLVARRVAQSESPARMGPDRHSSDGLTDHPLGITFKTRDVDLAIPREGHRHRRDQSPLKLFHRDRHANITRIPGSSVVLSGRSAILLSAPCEVSIISHPVADATVSTPAGSSRHADFETHRHRHPAKNQRSMNTTFDFLIPEARLLLTLFPRVVRTRNSPRLPLRLTSLRIPPSRGLTNGINDAMIECVHEANWAPSERAGDLPDDLGRDATARLGWGDRWPSTGISAGSPGVASTARSAQTDREIERRRARIDRTWAAPSTAGREGR